MAVRKAGILKSTMENIVSNPLKATITVGVSILILLEIINAAEAIHWSIGLLRYLAPFVPPFIITRTARDIIQKRAEHDFVKDAEPYIFVAYPGEASEEALLNARPEIASDSASRHLNLPIEQVVEMEALPSSKLADPEDRKKIIRKLTSDFGTNNYGAITGYKLFLQPQENGKPVPYLMNTVLKRSGQRLKWQATLMKYKNVSL